jgi:hypothetical protein
MNYSVCGQGGLEWMSATLQEASFVASGQVE